MNLYWGLQSHKNSFFLFYIPKSKTFADSFWRILESKNVAKCGKNSYGLRETPKWVKYDNRPVVLTWEQFCPQWTFLSCSASRRGTTVVVYGAEPRAAAAHRTERRIPLTMKNYLVQNVSGATVETAWARLRYSQMILKCMRFFFLPRAG